MTILIVFLKLKDLSGSQIVISYPSKSSKMLPERPQWHGLFDWFNSEWIHVTDHSASLLIGPDTTCLRIWLNFTKKSVLVPKLTFQNCLFICHACGWEKMENLYRWQLKVHWHNLFRKLLRNYLWLHCIPQSVLFWWKKLIILIKETTPEIFGTP